MKRPRIFCGFSDLTSVHIFLWQKLRWVTFYGPLVAGGFDAGANATGRVRSGYIHVRDDGDQQRLVHAAARGNAGARHGRRERCWADASR